MLRRPRFLKSFILILSHKNSVCREKQLSDIKNYSSLNNFYYYYFIGDPNIDKSYLVDEENKIVYLKVQDNYESLSLKVYYALKFIYDNFSDKISGIFKTDDDITLNIDLIQRLKLNYQSYNYFGNVNYINIDASDYHFGKCENEILNKIQMYVPFGTKYCSGGGYYLNISLISSILSEFEKFNKIIYEDVVIGYILSEINIEPFHIDVKKNGFSW